MSQKLTETINKARALLNHVTQRADSGWERVQTGRFLGADSYVPDIVNAAKHYGNLLFNLTVETATALDKETKKVEEMEKMKSEKSGDAEKELARTKKELTEEEERFDLLCNRLGCRKGKYRSETYYEALEKINQLEKAPATQQVTSSSSNPDKELSAYKTKIYDEDWEDLCLLAKKFE
jgi:hypothetical protein